MRKLFSAALVALVIALCVATQGQTKPELKPIALSPEASVQWLEDQRQINELQQRIDNLQLQQKILAAKAQVPDDYTLNPMLTPDRRVVYMPPKTEAAKAAPEKK